MVVKSCSRPLRFGSKMLCQITITCQNQGTEKVTVNDWRTGYEPKELWMCPACLALEPIIKVDHEQWEQRMKEEDKSGEPVRD